MNTQLSLTGFDPVSSLSRPTDRSFFAIFPDAESAPRLASLAEDLRDQHGLRGQALAAGRFHITLHHLGDYAGLPNKIVAMAMKAGASVAAAPFEIALDRG